MLRDMSVLEDWNAGSGTYALDFIFLEVGDFVCDQPGEAAAEVDDFVHHERHDSRGKHIVLHISVPCCPRLFEHIEMYIVLGDLLKVIGVRGWRGE